jgi:hypothetical protein
MCGIPFGPFAFDLPLLLWRRSRAAFVREVKENVRTNWARVNSVFLVHMRKLRPSNFSGIDGGRAWLNVRWNGRDLDSFLLLMGKWA